jgi:citrate lyase subunit beta/citryl-CoA lyase
LSSWLKPGALRGWLINDEACLSEDAVLAKQLGFKGKLAINPCQLDVIHSIVNPSEQEIAWAQ